MATKKIDQSSPTTTKHILIIPYPAKGHMLPLLDLARLLSLHNLTVTIAITPKNLPLISPLLSSSPSIQPLILPPLDHPYLPPNVESADDIPPSPSSFAALTYALCSLLPPILHWARSSSAAHPPHAIISDFFLGWTLNLASLLNIPRIVFSPSGALALEIINSIWLHNPTPGPGAAPVRFDSLPNSPVYRWDELSSLYRACLETGDSELFQSLREGFVANTKSWGVIVNTFEDLEPPYMDHLRKEVGGGRAWAVGPLSLLGGPRPDAAAAAAEDVMRWLEEREQGSVVYVCFGSVTVLSAAQEAAVEAGLERSGYQFVWSMRAAGAHEMVEKGRGIVVRGWVPQVKVLEHEAVGAFVTHCGWNSVMEGVAAGVAMLTWPMGADQHYNARLLEEDVGIGLRVCQGRESMLDPNRFAMAVSEVLEGRGEGLRLRAKAKEMRSRALAAVSDGGSSHTEIGALVESLRRLQTQG